MLANSTHPRRVFTALTLSLGLIALTILFASAPAHSQPNSAGLTKPAQLEFAPGVVLVGLKDGATLPVGADRRPLAVASSLGATLTALQIQSVEQVFHDLPSAVSPLHSIYRLRLPASGDVLAAVAVLATNPEVAFAEPDYLARAALTPNDQFYGQQWALDKIGAATAWNTVTGTQSVVIAIVDSGLQLDHPEFVNRLWVNPGESGGTAGVDDDSNGVIDDLNGWNFVGNNATLDDDNGHGTQVAGVAGATGNNGVGIAGVCWGCGLMTVKVMQASGVVNYSDLATGVAYAASKGAHIINLSLGGYADSATLRAAIESAAQTAVIVAGAGNDNSSAPFYPAAYPDVMAVAATDQNDAKAALSNYGAWVDLVAPGVFISTTFVGGYGTNQGTSLSTAFVAGVAGLLKSQHADWSPALVKWQMLNTATAVEGLNPGYAGQLGRGRLDANAAISQSPQAAAIVEGWAVNGVAGARPAPGDAFQLALTLRNTWKPAQSLTGTVSESDGFVTVTDASGAFGNIDPGQTGSNATDTFGISLANNTPYNHPILFTLNLSGANGYSLSLPFTLTVRSGLEYLPPSGTNNYIISANQTWTSDKTYILRGNVIVATGITLTIQPGTVIKADADKFFRVDGTLIASGTVDSPIIFTTNSITNAKWVGLRFTASSIPATFDANSVYQAGSTVRYVNVSYATTGVDMSVAPYVADSIFANNGTALSTGSTSPRIERNTLSNNSTGIQMNGGQAVIQQNTISRNTGTGISGSGFPRIISNTISNNTGTAISMSCCGSNAPTIQDNYIVGNGGGINASNLQGVDIEHNLIANNKSSGICPPCTGGATVYLDVSSSGNSQSKPALVYNPDRDEYLLTWSEAMKNQIKAQRVLSDGQAIGSAIDVILGYGSNVIYNPARQEYLVTGIGEGVLAQRLSATGSLLGSAIVITATGIIGAPIGANFGGIYQSADQTYLLTWQDGSSPYRLYAQRVLSDGALSGSAIVIGPELVSNSSLGDLAYDSARNQSLVTFKTDCYYCIHGAWITPSVMQSVTATRLITDQLGSVYNPAVAYSADADRYMALWEHDQSGRKLWGQVLSGDGSLPVSPTVVYSSATDSYTPRVMAIPGAGQFLTVWAHRQGAVNETIRGQRVLSDGILTGGTFMIASPTQFGTGLFSPVLAYNSQRNEFLTVWVDCRTAPCVLYGQRLSADGQLLDNAWTTADETNPAVNFRLTEARGVRYNTIINNSGNGLQLSGSAAGTVNIAGNNWFGNANYDVYMSAPSNVTVTMGANYWGSGDPSYRIYDCNQTANGCGDAQTTIGRVLYGAQLTSPNQTAPAFIQSLFLNPNPVGIERGMVNIAFSKPMNTANLPDVTFHDARRGTLETMATWSVPTSPLMAQDATGNMWFRLGVGNGVSRYDGQSWVMFTITNSG